MNATAIRILRLALAMAAAVLMPVVHAEQPRNGVEDPLPVDSQWTGKLTQGGRTPRGNLSPPELNATLTITERRGNEFEAELHEWSGLLSIDFLVRGRVSRSADQGLTIEFVSHGVKGAPNVAIYFINVAYVARLTADGWRGSWTFEDKENDTSLAGEFHLRRSLE